MKTLESRLKKEHNNIATQLRNGRNKLKGSMPHLYEHLKASLQLDLPDFSYSPPGPPPAWKF
jgi:hypothetical protein